MKKLLFFTSFILIFFILDSSLVSSLTENEKKLKEISNLGEHQRNLPHLITDKPIYKPGDKIHYKILQINPIKRILFDSQLFKSINLKDSKGKIIHSNHLYNNAGEYQIPKDINGGQYSLEVESNGYQSFSNFSIESFSNPKITIDLIFQSNGYSPKDTVKVISLVKRADGSIPESADLEFSVLLDGKEIKNEFLKLVKEDEGKKSFSFEVPDFLSPDSSMLLSMKVIEGGIVEQKSKSVPLILKEDDLEIKFYPEGGNVVHQAENTIYFESLSKSGDPVDVELEIQFLNNTKRVESKHEGRGSFTITPQLNDNVIIKLVRPPTLQTFSLPKIEKEGVVVNFRETVLQTESSVMFNIINVSPKTRQFKICIYQKEKELSSKTVTLSSFGDSQVELSLPTNVVGVFRFTVYEVSLVNRNKVFLPQYERLLFRKPMKNIFLSVECKSNETQFFSINSQVDCNITSRDENDQPISVFLIVDVVDDSVLSLVEKRKKRLQIAEKVLLVDEFSHVEDSGSYFNEENLNSDSNLELLMGIQGWRRFCYQNITQFTEKFKLKAQRLISSPKNEEIQERVQDLGRQRMRGFMENERFFAPAMNDMQEAFVQREAGFVNKKRSIQKKNFNTNSDTIAKETYKTKNTENKFHHRTNFLETLYSVYGLKTNEENGVASFSFKTSDSITSYRVLVEGIFSDSHSVKGENGFNMASHFSTLISCKNKFFVEPKLPSFVLEGDILHLPITYVYNEQRKIQVETEFQIPNEISTQNPSRIYPFHLDEKNQRTRKILPLKISEIEGRKVLNVTISAEASSSSKDFHIGDIVTRPFVATFKGIQQNIFNSGLLTSEKNLSFSLNLPQNTFQISTLNSKIFPKPTSTLLSAIDTLISEPHGCFEQTSATLFPMIMALNYMKVKNIKNEELFGKAQKYLKSGYEKLASYEVKETGGFEWFGRNPSSESLTAYGIFELEEMSKVFDGVDPKLISRAKSFLMNRKKEDGFKQANVALDTFGRAPEKLTDAYIIWSLVKSNINSTILSTQISDLKKQVFTLSKWESDPYFLAIVSDILFKVGEKEDSLIIAKRLLNFVEKDGSVDKSFTTITCSHGLSKSIETTSLSILAWLNFANEFTTQINFSISNLLSKCNGAKFGSTQGTILALYALIEFDLKFPSSDSKATIKMVVNNDTKNEISFEFDPSSLNPINFPPFHHLLNENSVNTFDLSLKTEKENKVSVPFSIDINYKTEYPLSHPQSPFNLNVDFINPLGNSFLEGKSYQIKVSLDNKWDKPLGMTIVKVGIPGGFAIRFEKLKELVADRQIAHYETKENSIIFYLDFMKPLEKISFIFDVDAFAPGSYRSSPTFAYLYYGDEYKSYIPFVLIADIKAIQ